MIIRLKDLSHIEAEFDTKEELNAFMEKHKHNIIPHETEFIDRKKIQDNKNQETLGWFAMIAIGLITLYFMFK